MGHGDHFVWGIYNSDNGKAYSVKLSAADAACGGFNTVAQPLLATGGPWPFHPHDMRHVTGKTSTGKPGRLPCASAVWSLWANGTGTWTNSVTGETYTVLGAEGENRKASHIS